MPTHTRLSYLRPLARRLRRWKHRTHPELPNELWVEIFNMVDDIDLVSVTRVNRIFNAIAVPIYLTRLSVPAAELAAGTLKLPQYRQDIFRVLQTAFFLPQIRTLVCTVAGDRRSQIIGCLQRFIGQQRALEQLHLTFHDDPFTGYGPPRQRKLSRRTGQHTVARLLNSTTRAGKALIIGAEGRALVSGSEPGKLWSVVRVAIAPPGRGLRARVRKAVKAMGKHTPAHTDLVLSTVFRADGILYRDAHVVDRLYSLDILYAAGAADWTLVVLNAQFTKRFSLPAALSAAEWVSVLPRLSLPALNEFTMGRGTTWGDCVLRDVGRADLDAFLVRHQKISILEYAPRAAPVARSAFSLGALPGLRKLTTTPAHFLHLHHAPDTFPNLRELVLFAPAEVDAQQDFLDVLTQLSRTAGGDAQGTRIRLSFPGAWLSRHACPLRGIHCVASMVVFGPFPLHAPTFAAFLAPFAPGLRTVDVYPGSGHGGFACMAFVDEVRKRCAWLQYLGCVRWDTDVRGVVHDRLRQPFTNSIAWED